MADCIGELLLARARAAVINVFPYTSSVGCTAVSERSKKLCLTQLAGCYVSIQSIFVQRKT